MAEDIGSYSFKLWARNSANLTVSELAEIRVRQHQSERAFNHRFTLQLEPEFDNDEMTLPSAFWMLKTVGALSKVLGDREDSIVVRSVSGTLKNGDAFTLSWSNDSLPRTLCPENAVASIFDKFYNLQKDEVTTELDQELAPQLAVTYGNFSMDGNCKPLPTTPVPTVKTPELSGGLAPKVNHHPTVTNAVRLTRAFSFITFLGGWHIFNEDFYQFDMLMVIPRVKELREEIDGLHNILLIESSIKIDRGGDNQRCF